MYLQMDGVDDNLISPTLTFDTLEMDCLINSTQESSGRYVFDARAGLPNSHMQYDYNGDNLFWDSMYVNNVLQPSANPIYFRIDSRMKFKLVDVNGGGTENIHLFSSYINHAELAGNIYSVKLYLGQTLVAHYDMSTGTVDDQSGNGNHATLTGGTWVDEGEPSTPTGTSVTYAFDTQQSLYGSKSDSFDTLTRIFADRLTGSSTTQRIYADITSDYSTEQAYFNEVSTQANLRQAIHKTVNSTGDIDVFIYADRRTDGDMIQSIYYAVNTEYATTQTFYDEDLAIISRITIDGERNLNVLVAGERVLYADVGGERQLNVTVKGVIK